MKKRIKRTLLERVRRFFNRKSDKEVKAGMDREKQKPETEEKEPESPVGDTPEKELPTEPQPQTTEAPDAAEVSENGEGASAEEPAPPETPAAEYVPREEFDALKAEIADLKALISNLPKTSEPVDAGTQQELDKLTALENKWNN